MEIKLVKIVKSFAQEDIYYADFLVCQAVLLKGMRFNAKLKRIAPSLVKTEAGTAYTPITFPGKAAEVFKEMILQILANPLPENMESCDEFKRRRALERMEMEKARRIPKKEKRPFKAHYKRNFTPAGNPKGFSEVQLPKRG